MNRRLQQVLYGMVITLLALLPLLAQQGAKEGQWRAWASETGGAGYSLLDQINRDNVKNFQVAWSWKFDDFGNVNTEVTPLMVNGRLYFPLSPSRTIIGPMPEQARRCGRGSPRKTNVKPERPARMREVWRSGATEPTSGSLPSLPVSGWSLLTRRRVSRSATSA